MRDHPQPDELRTAPVFGAARSGTSGPGKTGPGKSGPGVTAFGVLGGIEALVRGMVLSVLPLVMYRAFRDAQVVSEIYFAVGILSMCTGLLVPLLTRAVPRRWVYTIGCGLFLLSALCGIIGGPLTSLALLTNAMAAATVFVCFNAYVLDNVAKADLGRLEGLRMFFGGIGWTVGPISGVWLLQFWHGAPFAISGVAAAVMLATFWAMRMGNGRVIARARSASPNPFSYLGRFFAQPRLIAGWFFAVMRSCGWWVYVVYVAIFAVDNGLGDQVGGIALSLTNMGLFAAPLMLRWMQARSVRAAVRMGFLVCGLLFILGTGFSAMPWASVAVLMAAALFLVFLDICGGLPFLMSVKPSERTEMSAVYSSFRDVSGIVTPGVAWLVLQVAPIEAIFAVTGVGLLVAWAVAGFLHPELGVPGNVRQRRGLT